MSRADEPAFPKMMSEMASAPRKHWLEGGISKRELFAAMAMQGILSNDDALAQLLSELGHYKSPAPVTPNIVAGMSLNYADAMIKELERKVE